MTKKQCCIAVAVVASLIIALYGCDRGKSAEPSAIETLAGKPQLEAYKKTRSALEEINRSRREQYQEIE